MKIAFVALAPFQLWPDFAAFSPSPHFSFSNIGCPPGSFPALRDGHLIHLTSWKDKYSLVECEAPASPLTQTGDEEKVSFCQTQTPNSSTPTDADMKIPAILKTFVAHLSTKQNLFVSLIHAMSISHFVDKTDYFIAGMESQIYLTFEKNFKSSLWGYRVFIFSRLRLADYPRRRNVDGFLRLTHGFCLERSNSEQAGPPGTSVYTASQARLGGPIFTPRCFPKKTSSRGPLPEVKQLKTIHSTSGSCYPAACFWCTLITWKENLRLYNRKITF